MANIDSKLIDIYGMEILGYLNWESFNMVLPLALKLNDLVNFVADKVSDYLSQEWTLGLSCAGPESKHRSYLISLMTANAVLESKKRLGRSPQVVVLGTGSGLDSLTAALVDEDVKVIAYENDRFSAKFARGLFSEYGIEKRVELRQKNFLRDDMSGILADVVVNENLSKWLVDEPQLAAAQKILPYTNKSTLFVPGGLDIYVQRGFTGKSEFYFGRIDFSEYHQSPIVLKHQFKAGEIWDSEIYTCCLMDLLDHNKQHVFKERFYFPSNFDLGHEVLFKIPDFNPKSDYELRIAYHFSPDNNPEKANVTFEVVRLVSISS